MPGRPLGSPPSQRKVPKFSGVPCLSLGHWPSSFLSFIPRKEDFPPAIWGWEGHGHQTHEEGKLRTPPDPAPQPWDTVALGGGLLSWERLFLTGSKWPELSTFSTPVRSGGKPEVCGTISLQQGCPVSWLTSFRRGGDHAVCQLCPVWWAAGVRTGHPGSVPASAGCPGCTCPPPSHSLTLLGPCGKQAPP